MQGRVLVMFACGVVAGCGTHELGQIRVARLGQPAGDGFGTLGREFEQGHAQRQIAWHPGTSSLDAADRSRVVFVHGHDRQGRSIGHLSEPVEADVSVGDLVLLRPNETLKTAGGTLDLVVFTVPDAFPDELPWVIRPDNDPDISDTPGGCATDADAYRRVALTWLPEKGPYVYHGLNAHRVLITDSLTHYHPVDTGWDEFYLVQGARPGAGIWISRETDLIERPGDVDAQDVGDLLEWLPVESGDLVLLPRGTVHRGVGGVLVHVLAIPGFVPDNEIPVDEHLDAINTRLGLTGRSALPCHGCTSGAH